MRSCYRKLIWLILIPTLALPAILCWGSGVLAQSGRKPQPQPGKPEQGPPGEKPVLRIETKEVVIPLRAYDLDGKSVDDLTTKDVLVIEDDEPRLVTSIKHEPANIVLVLDLCNEIGTFKNGPSNYNRVPEEEQKTAGKDAPVYQKPYQVMARPTPREFADNFVSSLSPKDQIAIIQYSDRTQLIQDWTSDRNEAMHSLSSKYRIGLKSRYYDALALAAKKLQERSSGRRIMVLVSDGIDTDSRTTQPQALAAIKRSQATVYVIGWAQALGEEIRLALGWMNRQSSPGIQVVGNSRKRRAELTSYLGALEGAAIELKNIAETSGGEMWLPPTHKDLTASFPTLLSEIGAQYSLAFLTELKPSLDDLHLIKVLPARRGLSVRSRQSYYVGGQ
ncbi:MAG TPA: VWA domain-containing protein [Blastocatellia bacterium]|nr:VWA domain-containing protein [Blastocatellia bacterium]